MIRLTGILLLIFYTGYVFAQPSSIRINIYIEKGASAGMSYFDSEGSYDVTFIRTPILAKDSLIEKVIYTTHPILLTDGFKKLTQYPLFPGDDITLRCRPNDRTVKNNPASASNNALLFFTALNKEGRDMDPGNNTSEKETFTKVINYSDQLDSLLQLAYKEQLAFLDSYLQKRPMLPTQQQFIRDVLRFNMISCRLMPWYNKRFNNKPLSAHYLQSIAALKNEFKDTSLLYNNEYRFALLNYNRYLCKAVPNPPSGDKMKDAFYASAQQNFSPPLTDYLLYDLMRVSAMSSKEWFLKNFNRYNTDCHNTIFKKAINDIQQDVALAVKTGPGSIDLQDVTGKVIPLKNLLSQSADSVVYVDFWAGWCAPCLAEMPHSVTLKQQYKNKKITFLYFSLDNTRTEWLKSMKSQPQMNAANSYLVINGASSALSKWVNLNSIPRYIVYDKNKKLVQNDAPRPSDAGVQSLLNQLLEN